MLQDGCPSYGVLKDVSYDFGPVTEGILRRC